MDDEIIRDWWQRWPSAWVGIATGAASGGRWVLDVDTHAPAGGGLAGPAALALLEAQYHELPLTWRAATGSGGAHFWWTMPEGRALPKNRVAIEVQGQRVGLDVRSTGGYVVAPPSGHYSGGRYVWEARGVLAVAPGWLCDLVAPVEAPRAPYVAPVMAFGADLSREQTYARRALESAVAKVAGTGEGARRNTLLTAARTVGGFARLLDEAEALELLIGAGVAAGLGRGEAEKAARAGWAFGASQPLVVPDRPLPPPPPIERPDLDARASSGGATSWLRLVDPVPEMPAWVMERDRGIDEQVERLLNPTPTPPPIPPPGRDEPADSTRGRPEIVVSGRQLRELVDAAWAAVVGQDDLYQRDGRVVRIQGSEHGARIEEATEGAMADRLSRAADWFTLRPARKGEVTEEGMVKAPLAAIPRPVLQAMLAVPSPRVPVLDGIVASPVLDADGELVASPGYHPRARLWYAGTRMVRRPMSSQAAVDLLLGEWLGDFRFAQGADRAAALGFLVQLVMRRMIPAACPLHVFEAPVQGSGKDLLVQVLSTVGLGGAPVVQAWAASPEERQKKLMAGLMAGSSLIWIGNVTGRLADPTLAAILTAHPVYEDRVLGGSIMGRVTTAGLSMACTVNNASMDDDIATRAVRVRIDTGLEDPTVGRKFRHKDLPAWTIAHRDELLSAVLVLIDSARAEGAEWRGPVHGRYPTWSRIVGQVIEAAGLEQDWLGHRDEMRSLASPEAREWAALVEAWAQRGGQRSSAGDLAAYCMAHEILLGVMGEGKQAARGLSRGLAGLRDRIWAIDGVRWKMGRATQVQGRTTYALDCLDPDLVLDMGARRARKWNEGGPLWATQQDQL